MLIETSKDSEINVRTLAEAINKIAEVIFKKRVQMVYEVLNGAKAVYEKGTQEQLLFSLENVVKNKLQFNFNSKELINWKYINNREELLRFFDSFDFRIKFEINIQQKSFSIKEVKQMKLKAEVLDLTRIEEMLNELIELDFMSLEEDYQMWIKTINGNEFKSKIKQKYVFSEVKEEEEGNNEISDPLMKKFAMKKAFFDTLLRIDKNIQLPDMKMIGNILNSENLSEKEKCDYLVKERIKNIVQIIEFPFENQKYVSLVRDKDIESFLELVKVKVEVGINLVTSQWVIQNVYIDWSKLSNADGWKNKYYVAKELGLKMNERENENGQIEYFVDYKQFTDATGEWVKNNLVLKIDPLKEEMMKKVKQFQEKVRKIIEAT